jgi:hypothetical protein
MAGGPRPVKGTAGSAPVFSPADDQEAGMRVIFIGATLATLGLASTPAAAQGAWCAEDMNARNCGFYTLAQCQAAASGLGAGCYPNHFVTRAPAAEPRKAGRRGRHNH